MKIGEIENGVPLPVTGAAKFKLVIMNAERLEVGQSFLVAPEKEKEFTPRGLSCALGRRGKIIGRKFKCANIGDGHVRIWRVK